MVSNFLKLTPFFRGRKIFCKTTKKKELNRNKKENARCCCFFEYQIDY